MSEFSSIIPGWLEAKLGDITPEQVAEASTFLHPTDPTGDTWTDDELYEALSVIAITAIAEAGGWPGVTPSQEGADFGAVLLGAFGVASKSAAAYEVGLSMLLPIVQADIIEHLGLNIPRA